MADFGIVTEGGDLRFERRLSAPVERVWAHLVQSDLRAQWFAAGDIEPCEGGKVTLVFNNSRLALPDEPLPEEHARFEGMVTGGRVVRWDPPRLIAFVWEEEAGEDSEVTFELEDLGEQTLLVLTHRLLSPTIRSDVSAGWHLHLDVLENLLAGEPRRPYWPRHAELQRFYADRAGLSAGAAIQS